MALVAVYLVYWSPVLALLVIIDIMAAQTVTQPPVPGQLTVYLPEISSLVGLGFLQVAVEAVCVTFDILSHRHGLSQINLFL